MHLKTWNFKNKRHLNIDIAEFITFINEKIEIGSKYKVFLEISQYYKLFKDKDYFKLIIITKKYIFKNSG